MVQQWGSEELSDIELPSVEPLVFRPSLSKGRDLEEQGFFLQEMRLQWVLKDAGDGDNLVLTGETLGQTLGQTNKEKVGFLLASWG